MSHVNLPADFGEPLPRWTVLPDDPPDLRRWLRDQAPAEDTEDVPPPTEESP